jgi:hypothetical protein
MVFCPFRKLKIREKSARQLFEDHGVDERPPGSVCCFRLQIRSAFLAGFAGPASGAGSGCDGDAVSQTVLTENVDMTDSTILGIEKVTADSDDNTLFAVSFDGGTTWWNYVDNAWAVLSDEQSGMTKAALADIGTDAWALKATTGHYMFRFSFRRKLREQHRRRLPELGGLRNEAKR